MDRRDFLKVLGVVSVAPMVVARAFEKPPVSSEYAPMKPMTATRAMLEERERMYFGSCRGGKTDSHIYDSLMYGMKRGKLTWGA